MKHRHTILTCLMLLACLGVRAQGYSFKFDLDGADDTTLYIARHHRDNLQLLDSAKRAKDGSYTFKGKKSWTKGVYALVRQDGKKQVADFVIDHSLRFAISGDANLGAQSVRVKGCTSNEQMFGYMATEEAARKQQEEIRKRKEGADEATKAQAEKEEDELYNRIKKYEAEARHPKKSNIFFTLLNLCENPDVPDSVEDKAYYFRRHYWDTFFDAKARKEAGLSDEQLIHSPNLFNKMNYFFYGVLYYAESDTINAEIDRLATRIGDDTALLRFVFDHIEPRYFRSTKNIGWDAVWCHLASTYYLAGRCPWISEGTLHNMRYNHSRISKSLIGSHGAELWMADTNQSDNPDDWISSHRFPERYVILWFWDPDCHHCQEQSEELKSLYDSLVASGRKRFEVYAIGYESDVNKWKKYVRDHKFNWVNVGGVNVNIDYQEAYNVHGAPTMIILNERRDIIMNKVISIKGLMKFLDDYEKRAGK